MITITNTGSVPVRVAGQYLQPGDSLPVVDATAVALMLANPDVVEAGSEPAKAEDKPTTVYEVTGESPFRDSTKRKK